MGKKQSSKGGRDHSILVIRCKDAQGNHYRAVKAGKYEIRKKHCKSFDELHDGSSRIAVAVDYPDGKTSIERCFVFRGKLNGDGEKLVINVVDEGLEIEKDGMQAEMASLKDALDSAIGEEGYQALVKDPKLKDLASSLIGGVGEEVVPASRKMKWDVLLSDEWGYPEKFHDAADEKWRQSVQPSQLELDYQNIVSSSVVRALQNKAQVFSLDSSTLVRTRLTHSMEVAQVAKTIAMALVKVSKRDLGLSEEQLGKVAIILETAGLLHDIGNPPFGHAGERSMKDWLEKWLEGGKCPITASILKSDLKYIEGNAQAMRFLTSMPPMGDLEEIRVSHAVLSAMTKYTTCVTEFEEDKAVVWKHKPGYYWSERKQMANVFEKMGIVKKSGSYVRNPLAFLLEAADDIAYNTSDFEDSIIKGIITSDNLRHYARKYEEQWTIGANDGKNDLKERVRTSRRELLEKLADDLDDPDANDLATLHKTMRSIRTAMIYTATFMFAKEFESIMTGEFESELLGASDSFEKPTIELIKNMKKKYVYNNGEVVRAEQEGEWILEYLLDRFSSYLSRKDNTEIHDEGEEFKSLPRLLRDRIRDVRKSAEKELKENKAELEMHAIDEKSLYAYYEMRAVIDFISLLTDTRARELFDLYNRLDIPKRARMEIERF